MSSRRRSSNALGANASWANALGAVILATVCSCEEKPTEAEQTSTASAPVATPAPTPSIVKPPPPPEPRDDCPEGSAGPGTFDKPCEAKGDSRMMEVTWTGKYDNAGPTFRVINQSKLVILYGDIAVYFYDKAGKQLKTAGDSPKQMQTCSGMIFAGIMKPEEKAVITFSCVAKSHVPEGTETIEAEMRKVGFSDEEGKKIEFYWQNNDLVPEARPKGGITSPDAKKKSKKKAK